MVFFKFSQFSSQIRFVRSGILLSTVIMANVNTTEVDNKMLDNLLSDDELNISIIRESQHRSRIRSRHQYKRKIHYHLEEKVPR